MRQVMPKDQAELREIVCRAVGNKTAKLLLHIRKVEAESHRWKLKYYSVKPKRLSRSAGAPRET